MKSVLRAASIDRQAIGIEHNAVFGRSLAIVSVSLSIGIVGWVLWYCRYGLDFTDEGYYLNSISHPFEYAASVTQFGFVYHPLYLLADESVAGLRQTNLIVTYGLACMAVWVLLRNVFGQYALSLTDRVAVTMALAIPSLLSAVLVGMWLPTPSYNTLTFQGLLIAATGLFLADKTSTRPSILGWVLIGLGGCITFLGKPTSAGALALLVAGYVAFSAQFRIKLLAIMIGTALSLLALFAMLLDGSISGFIDRIHEGLLMSLYLQGDTQLKTLVRLESPNVAKHIRLVLAMCAIACSIFLSMWLTRIEFPKVGTLSVTIALLLGTFTFFYIVLLNSIPAEGRSILVVSIPGGLAAASLSMYRRGCVNRIGCSQLMLCLTILAFPYAYAFGTNNNYWIPIGTASVFVVLAGLIVSGLVAQEPKLSRMLLVAGLFLQVLVVMLIDSAFSFPYRQPQPLYQNQKTISVGGTGATLILSNSHADYLSSLRNIANKNDLKIDMPVIDLTGHSPGALYVLGVQSVGLPWSIGGYSGSAKFVTQALKKMSCEQLSRAWLLSEPKGPRSVPSDVLNSFGATLESDYEIVGETRSPGGQVQYLSKPTRDVKGAIKACQATTANST